MGAQEERKARSELGLLLTDMKVCHYGDLTCTCTETSFQLLWTLHPADGQCSGKDSMARIQLRDDQRLCFLHLDQHINRVQNCAAETKIEMRSLSTAASYDSYSE